MNTYKHSGTSGDLIYSLPIVQHTGGGEFYLHLNQIDWIGKHFYGVDPSPFHKGRMTQKDFDFMKSFMEAQKYLSKFSILDPNLNEITHNLDRFRAPFVGHPGNYVDIYAGCFGITDAVTKQHLRNAPWLTVPETKLGINGRDVIVNRTGRWVPGERNAKWDEWRTLLEQRAVFIGLASEHQEFVKNIGINIPYQHVTDMLDMAQYIAGSSTFIGNQSVALSIAIGLGHTDIRCEARRDLPLDRNECYFKDRPGIMYF